MADILTIRQTRERAKADGLTVSETALRHWVKTGEIPSRMSGRTALLYYPNVVKFITCADNSQGSGEGV